MILSQFVADAQWEGETEPEPQGAPHKVILETRELSVAYGPTVALDSVSLALREHRVTAIIGPSGCGKSTLLRSFNRMNDFLTGVQINGQVYFRGHDLYARDTDPVQVRRRVGMVFQKPNPFPKSIYKNVAWGPLVNGMRQGLKERVERSLRKAALWHEVKDRLNEPATSLSGGQQQRLCIARALALEPEVLLMDEPCSALDPASTSRIEHLILELRERYTIVIVTHNMQQAARVADDTVFLDAGRLVEAGRTRDVFAQPKQKRTEDYVMGRFG